MVAAAAGQRKVPASEEMRMTRRWAPLGVTALLTLGLGLIGAAPAAAQDWPSRPIRLIVPFAAGGPTDVVARLIAPVMGKTLGQPIVVEPRPGAGGTIGVEAAAKAAPDGYTLSMASAGTLALSPNLRRQMPYEVARDLAPITLVVIVHEPLMVRADAPWKTLGDLIAAAKARPGTLTYGSSGPGGMPHLAAELIKQAAGGLEITHVPYRGGAPLTLALLAGEVQMGLPDLPAVLPHIKEGTLRALAIGTERRSPFLPDVPTFAEAGLPGVLTDNWHGMVAPMRTPEAVLAAVHKAALAALRDPETVAALQRQGAIPVGNSRAEFGAFIARETARWAEVIRRAGVTIE